MTRRQTTARSIEKAVADTELPMTRPIVQETAIERLAWARGAADARDEQSFIDEQIASAGRLRAHAVSEAADARRAAVELAERAEGRAIGDADRIHDGTVDALNRRKAELDRIIAGFEAALAASAPDGPVNQHPAQRAD